MKDLRKERKLYCTYSSVE